MDSLSSDPRPSASAPSPTTTINAWSQIVPSPDVETASPTVPQIPVGAPTSREPEENQVSVLMQGVVEPSMVLVDNSNSSTEQTALAHARVFEDACASGNDANEFSASLYETKAFDKAVEAQVSKLTWRKPSVGVEGDSEPLPVMGAIVWPALTEARNIKGSKSSGLRTPPPLLPKVTLSNLSSHSEGGSATSHPPAGLRQKSSSKGVPLGSVRSTLQSVENGSSLENHGLGNNHMRMKNNHQATPPMDHERIPHRRYDGMAPLGNNSRKWRNNNNNRDHGRAYFGWHQQGRFIENGADMATLLHEQRIGPRNMPRQFPYMHANPAYYPAPNFQDGGMYYFPPGVPDFVQGPPYYPTMTPPRGTRHGPEPESLQTMVLKQVEYYFSVENLCRDIFLRTHMDEQGSVPVSVIANFNRMRKLTSNVTLILEALKQSAVVEVQDDRIRRRNDGGRWRLSPEQVSAMNLRQEVTPSARSMVEEVHATQGASQGLASIPSPKKVNSTPAKIAQPGIAGPKEAESVEERDALCGDGNVLNVPNVDGNVTQVPNGALMGKDAASPHLVNERGVDKGEDNDIARQNGGETACKESKSGGEAAILDHKSSPSNSRIFESSPLPPHRAVADNTTAPNWKNAGGVSLWMGDDTFLIASQFERNVSLPLEPDYHLDSHNDEHEGDDTEVNDRDVQRLINSSHSSLSSFIAVP